MHSSSRKGPSWIGSFIRELSKDIRLWERKTQWMVVDFKGDLGLLKLGIKYFSWRSGPAASLAAFRASSPNRRGVLAHDFVTQRNAFVVQLPS